MNNITSNKLPPQIGTTNNYTQAKRIKLPRQTERATSNQEQVTSKQQRATIVSEVNQTASANKQPATSNKQPETSNKQQPSPPLSAYSRV